MKLFTPLYRSPQQRHLIFLIIEKSHLPGPAVSGLTVATAGLMTFTQYIFTIDVRINQFFGVIEIAKQPVHPGRMAPAAALCFTISASVVTSALLGRCVSRK
jgi:hypothetical protein